MEGEERGSIEAIDVVFLYQARMLVLPAQDVPGGVARTDLAYATLPNPRTDWFQNHENRGH